MAFKYPKYQPIAFEKLTENLYNERRKKCTNGGETYCQPIEKNDKTYFQLQGETTNCGVIANGDFDTFVDWQFNGGWFLNPVDSRAQNGWCDNTGASGSGNIDAGYLRQKSVFSENVIYEITFTAGVDGGCSAFQVLNLQVGTPLALTLYNSGTKIKTVTSPGTYTVQYIASKDGDLEFHLSDTSGNPIPSLNSDIKKSLTVDDVQVCSKATLAYIIEDQDGNEIDRVLPGSDKVKTSPSGQILAEVDWSSISEGCYHIVTSDASKWSGEKVVNETFDRKGGWVWGSNWFFGAPPGRPKGVAQLAGNLLKTDKIKGNGTKKNFTLNHTRLTRKVMAYGVKETTGEHVNLNVNHINDSQVEVKFNIAPEPDVNYTVYFHTYYPLWQKTAQKFVQNITYDVEIEIDNYDRDSLDVGIYNLDDNDNLIDEKIVKTGINSAGVHTFSFSFSDIAEREVLALIPSGTHPQNDTTHSFAVESVKVEGNEPSSLSGFKDRISECINLKQTHTCALLLEWDNEENAFGFNYEDFDFKFRLRIPGKLRHPSYEKEKNTFVDSKGGRTLLQSKTTKTQELSVEEVPEYIHDAIAVALEHDTLLIDGVEFVCDADSYDPTWRNTSLLAPAQVEVVKDNKLLENSNC